MSTVQRNFSSVPSSTQGTFRLSGWLLLGACLGCPGSLLIVWDYQVDGDPRIIGLHFMGLGAGYLVGSQLSQRHILGRDLRGLAKTAGVLGFAAFLALPFVAPPIPDIGRILLLGVIGLASGSLATALFSILQPAFAAHPEKTFSTCGVFFGCGCVLATLAADLVYLTGWRYWENVPLSVLCAVFLVRCIWGGPAGRIVDPHPSSTGDLRQVAAFLFTTLLLIQLGNEWAVAGWLPLFLIHTLGSSPGSAIFALALYFAVLTVGRIVAQRAATHVSSWRFLIAGIVVTMSGYLLLSLGQSLGDAYLGVVIIALGYSPIYPLMRKTLDERFSYQAGFYNRLLSIAVAGGLSVPWLLGYVDAYFGMGSILLVPALGSVAVLVLALLIMLEARLMRQPDLPGQSSLV